VRLFEAAIRQQERDEVYARMVEMRVAFGAAEEDFKRFLDRHLSPG